MIIVLPIQVNDIEADVLANSAGILAEDTRNEKPKSCGFRCGVISLNTLGAFRNALSGETLSTRLNMCVTPVQTLT